MDISKLSHGAKLVLGATIAFLIVSIFNWQEVEFAGIATAGVSMWNGWGVLAGLIALAIVVWEGLRLANMKIEIGLTPAMVTTALAILLVLFTVLKVLVDNEFRTFWAWLGLILAIAIVVGAFANMRDAGDSITDMRTSMGSAVTSVAGAARDATGRSDRGGDAEAPPPASSAPVAPAPPTMDAPEVPADDPPRPAS